MTAYPKSFRSQVVVLLLAIGTAAALHSPAGSTPARPSPDAAGSPMSGKELARQWFDVVINERDLAALSEFYAPDYVWHGPGGMELRGLDELRAFAGAILAASDDRRATVHQQVEEGDLVVTRFTSRGHHTGTWQGREATGRLWTTEGIVISRIADGKIAEDWEVIYQSGL